VLPIMWNLSCNKWKTYYASGPQNATPSKEKANTWIIHMKNRLALLTYFIFNHLHHIVLWFCWKPLSNFCVSCGDVLLSLPVFFRQRQHQRNKQQGLSQTQTTVITTCNQIKGILKQTYTKTPQTSKLVIALPNSLSKRIIENRVIK
jgi:hypothetical protein